MKMSNLVNGSSTISALTMAHQRQQNRSDSPLETFVATLYHGLQSIRDLWSGIQHARHTLAAGWDLWQHLTSNLF